jgi:uncharacterized protein (TIGR03067 family)
MSTLATVLLLMVVAQAPDEAVKAEMKRMEGTWRGVSAISDGKPLPDDRVKSVTTTIKADGTWVMFDGNETFDGTFTVDFSKSPKTANFVIKSGPSKDKTCLEIFETDGDTMKDCFVFVPTGKESSKERPTKFESEAGSGHYLWVWKREKGFADPEKVVQEQVEAYNRSDLEGFLKVYSADVKLYTYPDKELSSGLEAMRKGYGKMFAENPDLKVKIAKRIVQGDTVIDKEEVSTSKGAFTATAIYRVKEGKIIEVRFVE